MSAAIAAAASAAAKAVGGVMRGNQRTEAQAASHGVRMANANYQAEKALTAGATNASNAQINHAVANSSIEMSAAAQEAELSVAAAASGNIGGSAEQQLRQVERTKEYNMGQEDISFEQELDRIQATTQNSVTSAVTKMSDKDFDSMNAGAYGALAGATTYLSLR